MEIVINPLDPESVANAVRLLEEYQKSLAEKQTALVTESVRVGSDVANQVYAQHPGDHGVASAFYEVANGADGVTGILTATAPDGEIGFIEFGTGIKHPEWDSSQVPYTPPEHGSYGMHQGRDPGWWYYGGNLGNKDRGWESKRGNITDGRDPASAMLWARQTMIESVLDNAREVFRS